MHFASAISAVAALAVTAVTAAPVAEATAAAASQYGSWAVDYSWDSAASGFKQEKFSAVYSLDQTTATKTWTLLPPDDETTVVNPESFVASYDGSTVSLQQTVEIDGTKVTIYGSAPLATKCNSATGRYCSGSATVEVTQAVA
ncbi:hypothetical protein BFW01_g5570 [Lasiodiplodia theobromae]|uniref:Uncharacterized protein n=1 Tax=Lasiodiplodia theobromae TaxID=45133 RepID=A0A5N5CX94_9PEZI|nr:uncharacterized protein LTHEOB_782 [Lasiodiplodia theobromae]KAB2569983.1 hypothetical protein DBV05_g11367 [Lasiodiplodia theobromae]KAF4540840.1 hypothetical protein LTHEOB_782 [Lasiodiplodia theobromae]KAF9634675.1 hypothetical protein BFW01_g5570 [Lasiodiplodia theobromae]